MYISREISSPKASVPPASSSLQLIQMLQPRQDDLLARLLDLAGQEDLVEDGVDLVEVEDEVEFADIAEEGVEDLDEEVDGLEVGQLVVVGVDAGAEEEPRVPPVDNLVVAELDEVGLVLLVARRHEPVYLALELDLLVVARGEGVSDGGSSREEEGRGRWVASYCRFWMRMKESIAGAFGVGVRRTGRCGAGLRIGDRGRFEDGAPDGPMDVEIKVETYSVADGASWLGGYCGGFPGPLETNCSWDMDWKTQNFAAVGSPSAAAAKAEAIAAAAESAALRISAAIAAKAEAKAAIAIAAAESPITAPQSSQDAPLPLEDNLDDLLTNKEDTPASDKEELIKRLLKRYKKLNSAAACYAAKAKYDTILAIAAI
ncbi:hypothetical protein G7046_g6070 [Stylonectria norvegica]|nr:hypothetical protein G7046_g6070 [Stylonectria norvegica]